MLISYIVILCYIMLCYVVLCCVVLCYVVLCSGVTCRLTFEEVVLNCSMERLQYSPGINQKDFGRLSSCYHYTTEILN